MTVYDFAHQYDLWQPIVAAVDALKADAALLPRIGQVPVRSSSATRILGSYQSQCGEPRCIRLQFAQEPEHLRDTFLHEVAHLCDHLEAYTARAYRGGHGVNWQRWARALGISTARRGQSDALAALHQKRLKVVAVCERCHEPIYRVRRLPARRQYRHTRCGGRLRPV